MTEVPPTGTSAGSPAPSAKPVTTVTAGTLIMGTYEIEQLINSGGMGEVYRGRNIHNNELVAIKIVLPSLAHDPKIVALFQKESTTLSRLAHEAIVRYHVFTNDPTIGRPCMVMEFVSGTSLADRIEQGPMPLADVKTMLHRVASGLDKAHRAGVVHRDLSPDNVILEDDLVEHAKLIDFGIAKSSNFGSGTLLQGQFAGKFNWVSPEQLGAFGGHVDGRSDIYSLALITAGVSRGKVLQMGASIVDAVSSRSSVPDLEGVDPALVPLLRWMLEPNPANRIESMAKVIAALDNPALIPSKEALAPIPPDPNRTVIEPLPAQTAAPLSTPGVSQVGSLPPTPQTTGPAQGWDVQRQTNAPTTTSAPDGATVIAPHVTQTAPLAPETDSPFGAPGSPAPKPAAPIPTPAPAAKRGKGGLVATLAVLAIGAAGAGAYLSGAFDTKPVAPTEKTAEADPAKPADATDDAAQKAADEAAKAAEAEAATKAEADAAAAAAAEKQAADDAAAKAAAAAEAERQAAAQAEIDAAKTAEERALATAKAAAAEARSQASAVTAARSMAEAAVAEAQSAATDAAAAEPALVKGLADAASFAASKAKAAAEAATTGLQAATDAAKAANGADGKLDEVLASAAADAKAAADSAALADTAAQGAAETLRKSDAAEAARLAEEQAAKDAVQADPVARQQAFFAGLATDPCVLVQLANPDPKGFALHGFAPSTAPLEALSAAWAAATDLTPDIAVHLINEDQCAVLDFMNRHKSADSLGLTLTAKGDVVTSGTPVEGTINGVNGREVTLFLVNGKGGATNLKDFLTKDADGNVAFKFRVTLVGGLPPEPQLLMALVADDALAAMLDKVKPGTTSAGLMSFLDGRLDASSAAPLAGLTFFRLEN